MGQADVVSCGRVEVMWQVEVRRDAGQWEDAGQGGDVGQGKDAGQGGDALPPSPPRPRRCWRWRGLSPSPCFPGTRWPAPSTAGLSPCSSPPARGPRRPLVLRCGGGHGQGAFPLHPGGHLDLPLRARWRWWPAGRWPASCPLPRMVAEGSKVTAAVMEEDTTKYNTPKVSPGVRGLCITQNLSGNP